MLYQQILDSLGYLTDGQAREIFLANGFEINTEKEYDAQQVYLIQLYNAYRVAAQEAADVRKAFRYQDGEEMVDKSKVFDSYRRYANDLYSRWKSELDKYNRGRLSGTHFVIRKRADYLDV